MSTAAAFAGRTILITGGAGFIGSNLCRRILREDPASVVIVDNLLSADMANTPVDPRVDMRVGSCADERLLADLPDGVDYVFHLATYHGNQSSLHDPVADHQNNTLTTLMLMERLRRRRDVRKIVYASAGCTVARKTFDDVEATDEEAPVSLHLDSPYQISKIIGEFYGNFYFMRHGLPFVKARFQNVYGPGEILGAGRWRGTPATVWRNVTPTFIWKALQGQPLPVENGGVATRDFIYVDDIVEGLIACAVRGEAGEVYNLASGAETSIRDLADAINRLTGNGQAADLLPARVWDRSGKRYGDPRKAEQTIGFAAKIGLEEGLIRTIAWTRDNAAVIRRCIDQHEVFMRRLG